MLSRDLSRSDRRKEGFALLIALALMSFLLISIVGFTAVVRVESQVADLARKETVAREHARLALMVALGNLQKTAGPDQRATAPARILGVQTAPANQHVVGVWDSTLGANTEPEWMVSYPQDNPDPFDPGFVYSSSETVELLGEGTLGAGTDGANLVRVHRISIPDANEAALGNMAWWVADLGVKGSLGKWNRQAALKSNPNYDDEERGRMIQLTAGRPRQEVYFESIDETAESDAWQSREADIARIQHFDQLSFVQDIDPLVLADRYHDLTWNHRGVLSNSASGGLKLDLSSIAMEDTDGPFPINSEFKSFIGQRVDGNDYAPNRGVSPDVLTIGSPANPIPLVLTEMALYCGFFRTVARSNQLKMAMRLRADVWNPYTFPLGFTPRNNDDFIIEFDHMPRFTVEWETGRGASGSESGTIQVDVANLTWEDQLTDRSFQWNDFRFDIYDKMNVGEVRNIRQIVQAELPQGLTGDPNPNRVTDDFFRITAPAATINIRILTLDGDLVKEYQNIEFGGLDTAPFRPINIRSRSDPSYGDFQFVYHFRFYDEVQRLDGVTPSDTERWLSEFDPRSVTFDLGDATEAVMFDVSDDPGFAAIDGTLFLGRPEFFYGGGRFGGGQGGSNYHRFFDFPSTEPVSVGWLQHLYLHGKRPFSIGNPWGEELNATFDRYFFSSVPQSGSSWQPGQLLDPDQPSLGNMPLPNVHLELVASPFGEAATLDRLRSPMSARHFMVDGAFNIHSTRVDAWKAVLSGLNLYNWDYRRNESYQSVERTRVKNGLFRFPMGADRHFEHPHHTRGRDDAGNHTNSFPQYPEVSQQEHREWFKNKWQPDWAAAFTVGMRELREGENPDDINDVDELAGAIVEAIKRRGEPFLSMEDFVNSGVLQEAIDNTRINTATLQTYTEIGYNAFDQFPRYAPSFLTQADILSTIAPFVQNRSDTFTIRAYGDHLNSVTGELESRAWCEATVQRIPDPVEFSSPGSPSAVEQDQADPPGVFGRRFVVLDFRWLDEGDV